MTSKLFEVITPYAGLTILPQRVFHFSGGRTSAYMVKRHYQENDAVIFCDTGREHDKTYKFINDFEAFENIPVIRLRYIGGFEGLITKRQAVPNISYRFCSIELKIKTARRYLRTIGVTKYTQFIGFRAEEKDRVRDYKNHWKTVATHFPLYDDGINKDEILSFWKTMPYDLETPRLLGNCDCCFLKGKAAIIAIYQKEPERATKWIADEQRTGHTYIKGISHLQMLEAAKQLNKQYSLEDMFPEFSCACTT